jgi:hypothetical protein
MCARLTIRRQGVLALRVWKRADRAKLAEEPAEEHRRLAVTEAAPAFPLSQRSPAPVAVARSPEKRLGQFAQVVARI